MTLPLTVCFRAVVFILGYEKTSYGVCKIRKKYYFLINVEQSGPDLGLATGDPDVRNFD
jgi:hypothetical protein